VSEWGLWSTYEALGRIDDEVGTNQEVVMDGEEEEGRRDNNTSEGREDRQQQHTTR
jgi:hypothetical protein